MSHDELKLLHWLQCRRNHRPHLQLGIGDDMAIVGVDSDSILLSCDMLLEGVHFDSRHHSLDLIGRKATACNLSDCAAMAVRPHAITLAVALPESLRTQDAIQLFDAVAKTAEDFGAVLAGGDTNRWSGPLALDVAMLAFPLPGIAPLTRRGARPGDRLFVTGPLGGSLRGKHLTFTPRLTESYELAAAFGVNLHAMMDITDGLSLDLWRMCEASGVGAVLDEAMLEHAASEDARAASSEDNRTALDHVLTDGEDFELLLATNVDLTRTRVPLLPVGEIVESGFTIRRRGGAIETLQPAGYVH